MRHWLGVIVLWFTLFFCLPSHCSLPDPGCQTWQSLWCCGLRRRRRFPNLIERSKLLARFHGHFYIDINNDGRTIPLPKYYSTWQAPTSFLILMPLHASELELKKTWRPWTINGRLFIQLQPHEIHMYHECHVKMDATCWKAWCRGTISLTSCDPLRLQEPCLRPRQLSPVVFLLLS